MFFASFHCVLWFNPSSNEFIISFFPCFPHKKINTFPFVVTDLRYSVLQYGIYSDIFCTSFTVQFPQKHLSCFCECRTGRSCGWGEYLLCTFLSECPSSCGFTEIEMTKWEWMMQRISFSGKLVAGKRVVFQEVEHLIKRGIFASWLQWITKCLNLLK